ncbi:hypothetical protein SODALDRAFT_273885 [Sodiomyces alkalinus F11]|uniref:Small ribosomal subunit protein mS38 n=1 Tax=Sodiomyces alkalinus (strain CBS 110278 / VKM F-3762 / F11) TaxID=1314773 RepID=A0A3N2PZS2_SODAK|nr:hypothetical protein SODALDRAFT_273885 [Sodiomyces alkalinus F11]ROT39926.1 hypothetical protein SODALDRAFT_273885 [Sodiomyces alkalinus F11]
MWPSVRRVASVPASPLQVVSSSLTASAPRAAAPATVAVTVAIAARPGRHQRRFSSSKPSSSDNGPKDIPRPSAVPATASSRSGESKSNGEKRKRKAKDAVASPKLPSVPSTQHLSQEALGLSTFFSLHRPISVTHSIPRTISDETFASIFDKRSRAGNVSEVISTLSRTADELDGAMAKMTISDHAEADAHAHGDSVRKIDLKHPDGSESSVYVQLNAMAGQFVPFRPPPLPQPQPASASAGQDEAAAQMMDAAAEELLDESPQHRVYKALFTIEESTDPDGHVRVVAHSPRIVQEGAAPRSFLERMALRQMRFQEAQVAHDDDDDGGGAMRAISVRRQRKLKMKKKKYKKLMKRTRNLRRKLDRV